MSRGIRNGWRAVRLSGAAGLAAGLVAALGAGGGAVAAAPPDAGGEIVIDQAAADQLVVDDAHCGAGGLGVSIPTGGCHGDHHEPPPADTVPDAGPSADDDIYDIDADPTYRNEREIMDNLNPDSFYENPVTFRAVLGGTSTWQVAVPGPGGVSVRVPRDTANCWYDPWTDTSVVYHASHGLWAQRPDHHIYKYDHWPPLRPARRVGAHGDTGTWFHYWCNPTPSDIAGAPPGHKTAVQGDYYSHPHWVYSSKIADPGTIRRVESALTGFYAVEQAMDNRVMSSPAATSVVNLDTWVWADPGALDLQVGPYQVHARATGMVMSERAGVGHGDVQVYDSDPRSGGCSTGGQPWTRDAHPGARDLCYLRFLTATGPGQQYRFRFFVRWKITVGGASVTAWTSKTRAFDVRETQVVVGDR